MMGSCSFRLYAFRSSNKVIQSDPARQAAENVCMCLSKACSCKLTRLYCQIEKQTSHPPNIAPSRGGRKFPYFCSGCIFLDGINPSFVWYCLSESKQVHKDTLRILFIHSNEFVWSFGRLVG